MELLDLLYGFGPHVANADLFLAIARYSAH
jgi:hypothetical protein